MKIAIVHYWLVSMRGGEKVLEELCRLYPEADVFTLVLDPAALSPFLRARRITTSFLQRVPGARRHYQKMLPLMPFALEHLDLTAYDLVISSESGPAKGVVTRPDAVHVCYCHSPMRYVWDQYHLYRRDLPWPARVAMSLMAPVLRVWDVSTAARVDAFIANSQHVARRIKRFYNREATVIHPPVAVDDFAIEDGPKDFYLCAGQLVTYKRVDLAVRACTQTGRRLVVIGEGAQYDALRAMAGPTVEFLGHQPFSELRRHMAQCRALLFPGEEDFGIVPLEVMASGRPVIAFDSGGARETVAPGCGIRFADQTLEGMLSALDAFEAVEDRFDPQALRAHAGAFSPAVFREAIERFVGERLALAGKAAAPVPMRPADVPIELQAAE